MSQDASAPETAQTMRLRYAGTCRMCGQALAAGTVAVYERVTKSVRCDNCTGEAVTTSPVSMDGQPPDWAMNSGAPEPDLDPGQAGASARREHERRRDQ